MFDFDNIKNLIVGTGTILVAYFAPIQDMIFCIFFVFLLNFMTGLISGIRISNEKFNLRKFFRCIIESLVYYSLVAAIFVVGDHMDNKEGALQCITGITYAIIYFYTVNGLRNLHLLMPQSKGLGFIYYVVSLEGVKRIPYLENYMKKEGTDGKY